MIDTERLPFITITNNALPTDETICIKENEFEQVMKIMIVEDEKGI